MDVTCMQGQELHLGGACGACNFVRHCLDLHKSGRKRGTAETAEAIAFDDDMVFAVSAVSCVLDLVLKRFATTIHINLISD